MSDDTLQQIREKLDDLIDNKAEAQMILEVSVELDQLIEQFMEKQERMRLLRENYNMKL